MAGGRLKGKRCFMTAAGQGIGRAAALAMAAEGASVVATDRDPALLAGMEGMETRRLDVLDDAAVAEAIGAAGPLDALFNCAGFVHQNTALTCTDEEWNFAFALNVRAMWKAVRAALPAMLERRRGSIVNMASACSSVKGAPNRFLYGTTKAAVIGLTKSVGKELATTGVLVNAIAPAVIATPMLSQMSQEHIDYMVERIPMGRLGRPEEVAELIAFLASDRMTFSTGATFDVSGGRAVY